MITLGLANTSTLVELIRVSLVNDMLLSWSAGKYNPGI